MSPLWLALGLLLLGIFFSGLFSGAETGAYQFNRTRHRLALAAGDKRAHRVQGLASNITAFVMVCLIGTNLANTLVSFSATLSCEYLGLTAPEVWATAVIGPVLFILGELAPKELFRRHADQLLYAVTPLLSLAAWLFQPLILALSVVTTALHLLGLRPDPSREAHAEDRLRQEIAAGAEGGTLTDYQSTLARNIFSLRKRTVREAMIPLSKVDMLEASSDLEAARAQVREVGRARLPVYRNRREQVVGLLSTYDLLFEERPGLTIRNYVQPALQVDPAEKVAEALLRLRRARVTMAVVAQDGRALGVITIKDLVEEITGELQDL